METRSRTKRSKRFGPRVPTPEIIETIIADLEKSALLKAPIFVRGSYSLSYCPRDILVKAPHDGKFSMQICGLPALCYVITYDSMVVLTAKPDNPFRYRKESFSSDGNCDMSLITYEQPNDEILHVGTISNRSKNRPEASPDVLGHSAHLLTTRLLNNLTLSEVVSDGDYEITTTEIPDGILQVEISLNTRADLFEILLDCNKGYSLISKRRLIRKHFRPPFFSSGDKATNTSAKLEVSDYIMLPKSGLWFPTHIVDTVYGIDGAPNYLIDIHYHSVVEEGEQPYLLDFPEGTRVTDERLGDNRTSIKSKPEAQEVSNPPPTVEPVEIISPKTKAFKEFVYQTFSIGFPESPETKSIAASKRRGIATDIYTYRNADGSTIYLLSKQEYPGQDPLSILKGTRDSVGEDATDVTERVISIEGNPGLEVEFTRTWAGKSRRGINHIFMVGNTLYQLQAFTDDRDEALLFLNSFRLLK